jgi:hypothetical protein
MSKEIMTAKHDALMEKRKAGGDISSPSGFIGYKGK